MKTILFIHSAGPQGPQQGSYDFVEWLRRSLHPSHQILFPRMHDPETPEYPAWRDQLERELAVLDDEVIIIGHALGASVVLKYFSEEKISNHITALFLIATPFWGADEEWHVGDYILQKDFEKKLPNIPIQFYHSLDDEWVPSHHTKLYRARIADAKAFFLEGNDHDFDKGLPALLEDIRAL